jgi:superfamily II DNA helicase RecQ
MGFCRTNLFKRLESSGSSFLLSVERHILRNFIYLHAIEHNLPIPIGTQDSNLLDTRITDADETDDLGSAPQLPLRGELDFRDRASKIYELYAGPYRSRFDWIRPLFFKKELPESLLHDALELMRIFDKCNTWDPNQDAKLKALIKLTREKHKKQKILIFTQFGDTVSFLREQLTAAGVQGVAAVTGESDYVTDFVWRFSPVSNDKVDFAAQESEIRVLIATDVLSEGQNLQDAAIVVNYDLPWAIIRLIQRAGRVDRIGQKSDRILCYSFLPADGVERIIQLRAKVRGRLRQNAEVVGTDESFFGDDQHNREVNDLYHERAGLLDGDEDTEIDLASYAYQIWKNATEADPSLKKTIPDMPNVVFSTRKTDPQEQRQSGALVYLKTSAGSDTLAWCDTHGNRITDSQYKILRAAECEPGTPAAQRLPNHHQLVEKTVKELVEEEKNIGGGLGRPSGARFRTYERIKRYFDQVKGTLFETQQLQRAMDDVYRYPLRESAAEALNRQMKSGADDETIARLAIMLREESRLSVIQEDGDNEAETHIICSLGLTEK